MIFSLVSLMCTQLRISGCGLLSCAMWCIVGVVCLSLQMHPLIIFSVKRAPNSKILLHFDYIYDPLSIQINVEMGEMLL